jgi:hypothetical protein
MIGKEKISEMANKIVSGYNTHKIILFFEELEKNLCATLCNTLRL